MLVLNESIYQGILDHGRRDHPREACGVVVGSNKIGYRMYTMTNVSEHADREYAFDSEQQISVWMDFFNRGEDLIALYHSHTGTPPIPSQRDIMFAAWPNAHYVIFSTYTNEIKAYQIRNGVAVPDQIEVL